MSHTAGGHSKRPRALPYEDARNTMIRYDKLTIIRNRQRVRELVRFREVVERFFEKSEYVADDQPLDWEGARVARASD